MAGIDRQSLFDRHQTSRHQRLIRGQIHQLEFVEGADGKRQTGRFALAAERALLHVALDMPLGVRTVAEKDPVTDAIALRRHPIALQQYRSLEDHDGLVVAVVPVELALGAGPDQGRRRAARAGRQPVRASFRIAFNYPGWLDRRWLQIYVTMAGFNKR